MGFPAFEREKKAVRRGELQNKKEAVQMTASFN
jgi:hypothetical protein